MKFILFLLVLVTMISVDAFGVNVFDISFGNVQQGQTKTVGMQIDANDIDPTIAGDTPFEVQMPAPYTASPLSGTMRRFSDTTINITLPANAPFGVHDKKFKVILRKKNSSPFIEPLLRATVIGFPYQLTPPDILDLGSQSQGNFLIKNLSVSAERIRISARQFGVSTVAADINSGGTAQIIVSVPEQFQGTQPFQEPIAFTDNRSGQSKSILVKAQPGNANPDLVATIIAVKVFPRPTGATESDIQVAFNVKNVGFAPSVSCQTKVSLDNDKVLDLTTDAIGVGATGPSVVKSFKTNKTGSHTLKVKVDDNNQNNEPDENNNNAFKDIEIP